MTLLPNDEFFVFLMLPCILGKFDHFQNIMGLNDAKTEKYDSPFDYKKNSLLYVPQDMPDPSHNSYNLSLVKKIIPLVKSAKGRTFILSTSIKGVSEISSFLKNELEKNDLKFPVLTISSYIFFLLENSLLPLRFRLLQKQP